MCKFILFLDLFLLLSQATCRRRRFTGAELSTRFLQGFLNPRCGRVRAAEHAPRSPFRVLERRYCLAEIVERGGGVLGPRRRDAVDAFPRKDYSPGNKLISGLRDSAVSWAIILPLYWYCEKGAVAA